MYTDDSEMYCGESRQISCHKGIFAVYQGSIIYIKSNNATRRSDKNIFLSGKSSSQLKPKQPQKSVRKG